jgi:hypothetical protein
MLMNCFGVVTDHCLSHRRRDPRLMEQRGCCRSERVKRQLLNLSTCGSALRMSFVISLLPKSRTRKQVAELVRKISAFALSF